MANPCDLAEESGLFDDASQSDILDGGSAVDAAALDDAHEHVITSGLVEAATLNDAYVEGASFAAVDVGELDDEVSIGHAAAFDNVVERGELSEGTSSRLEQDTEELVDVSDAAADAVSSINVEVAQISDDVDTAGQFVSLAVDVASFSEQLRVAAPAYVVEAASISDAVVHVALQRDLAVDIAALSDAVLGGAMVVSECGDVAELSDAQESMLYGSDSAVDVGYFEDYVSGGATAAWTAHVETWAMSRYENFPVNSMASIGGALFGATDGGFVRLDSGADDDGVPVDATIEHDWINWTIDQRGNKSASNSLKRPRYLYLNEVKSGGQLALTLGYVTVNGAKGESEYPLPDTTATGFVNIRVPLGRGIRSQHLRPIVKNVAGADFEYGDGRLVVDSLARNL